MEGASQELQAAIDNWMKWDPNDTTKQEIQELVEAGNTEQLEKILLNRIKFGTAGLRARMGAGFTQMNLLTVLQSTQGVAKYLLEQVEGAKEMGFVLGYDARFNSVEFANISAHVLLSLGFKVYMLNEIFSATPFVPFSIKKYQAAGGVMVTASHNPKDDNGYKLYWSNGSQIIPPHDSNIQESIMNNLEPWQAYHTDYASLKEEFGDLLQDISQEATDAYFEQVVKLSYTSDKNPESKLRFVFTPVHGVGERWATRSFEAFGLPAYVSTEEQKKPDPTFPTVKFPNPEEGDGVLKLAIETAEANDIKIVVANDPDSDRLAVAEQQEDGQWTVFSGNQIGMMFAYWQWLNYKGEGKVAMLNSTVSSKMLGSMADKEGFLYEDTLTGFKWLGNRAQELLAEGYDVLFAYEEAIGFMLGDHVFDKDGISAVSIMAELANHIYTERNMNLAGLFAEMEDKYGKFIANNSYFVCHDKDTIKALFDEIRNDGEYPKECGGYAITSIRDLTTGVDTSEEDGKTKLFVDPTAQMITFKFENGCVATLRTSGTEPKIKYYVELVGTSSKEEIKTELDAMVKALIDNFLQPDKFGLIWRS